MSNLGAEDEELFSFGKKGAEEQPSVESVFVELQVWKKLYTANPTCWICEQGSGMLFLSPLSFGGSLLSRKFQKGARCLLWWEGEVGRLSRFAAETFSHQDISIWFTRFTTSK